MIKTVGVAGICIALHAASIAQTASLKTADDYYSKGDYYAASQLFEKVLSADVAKKTEYNPYTNNRVKGGAPDATQKAQAQYKLAESYYMLHQYAKAEPHFKASSDAGNANATYYYAKTLQYNNKLAEAAAAYTKFVGLSGTDAEKKAEANKQLKSIEFAKAQMARTDLARYTIAKAALNSEGATYAPADMAGQLVFTSTRPDAEYNKTKPNTNKVYRIVDGSKAEMLGLPADPNMEQGVTSFYNNYIYFTKWQLVDVKKKAGIYKSEKSGANWGAPVLLATSVNATGASSSQPFVTTDGKWLLFSSDMPGGMGQKDIWAVALDASGNPTGAPFNVKGINSAGDDEAPFYHQASKTLVFASNGHAGMGGYDLFSSKGEINATLQAPVNMGYPANSVKDDIYYMSTDPKSIWSKAYLSSDRNSECCLDLYTFNKQRVKKNIGGSVVDCKDGRPVSGVAIVARDEKGAQVYSGQTDANGKFSFVMDEFKSVETSLKAEGYEAASLRLNIAADDELEALTTAPLCINKEKPKPVEVNKVVVLSNVQYDFGKSTLSKKSYPVFDTLINWMQEYPGMKIELSSHTDDVGSDSYNQKLSEARAASCVEYLVSKGISRDRIVSKGYGESMPVAPNKFGGKDNPEGRKLNRRTEFKVLNY
jgi:outer membrane protein OmpA-like peptidoglycan-associated protein